MSKRCNHYWNYHHTIWQAKKDDNDAVAVGRYCSRCGKIQTAIARNWKPVPKSFVDMREVLLEEAGK